MTTQARYDGPRTLANAISGYSLVTLESEPFHKEGGKATTEYRDLGIAKATGGRVLMKHTRAIAPFDKETGWHWHDMNGHFVYVLRGWLKFRFAGHQGEVTVKAGDCLSQPAGVAHNVVGRSDDLELIEINMPAEFATTDIADPAKTRTG